MSDLPRYIVLGDTILDREKIVMIYRDRENAGRVWVQLLDTSKDQPFDSGDAIKLWRTFDADAGWKE